LFWIGCLIGIILIGIIPIIVEISLNKPKTSLPTDDIYSYSYGDLIYTNTSYLIAGRYENNSYSSPHFTFLRFKNEINGFSKCELSFYVCEFETCTSPVRDIEMHLYILSTADWNETDINQEKIEDMMFPLGSHLDLERRLGLHTYNITDLVNKCKNDPFFTLRIHGSGGIGETNYLRFYSKEADVSNDMKPQLIWS